MCKRVHELSVKCERLQQAALGKAESAAHTDPAADTDTDNR
jgi:hypothetical protein